MPDNSLKAVGYGANVLHMEFAPDIPTVRARIGAPKSLISIIGENLGLSVAVDSLQTEAGLDIETEAGEVIFLEEALTIIAKTRIKNSGGVTFVATIPRRG